jgi:hypothetical protein
MNKESKFAMKDLLYYALEHNDIRIDENCISSDAKLAELRQQLLNFTYVDKEHTDERGVKSYTTTLSGKLTSHTKDDLCIALMWSYYLRYKFRHETKYERARQSIFKI